ncbi:MAG: hypothetical protein FJ301_11945 [Planctomycetes bacterium]|nr:hypothetical protein [Planctomycetota bacterium]
MTQRFQRRRFLVDRGLQFRLCALGLLHGVVVLLAIVLGILAPVVLELSAAQPHRFEEQAVVMLYLHERMPWVVGFCVAILVAMALSQSHRIAGPLVRLKRNLRFVADGKLPPPLRTRSGDLMQEEVACLNAAVDGVARRIDAIQAAHDAVRAALDDLLAASVERENRRLATLSAALRGLDGAVAAFQPVDPGDQRPADRRIASSPAEAIAP